MVVLSFYTCFSRASTRRDAWTKVTHDIVTLRVNCSAAEETCLSLSFAAANHALAHQHVSVTFSMRRGIASASWMGRRPVLRHEESILIER